MSYAKNPDTNSIEILDRNDYYAFGMNMYTQTSVYDATGTPLNNKYNQKELQETGFYDYGWRQYMPDLGRWFGMDKLSEKFHMTSPYAYVANNPAMFVDPNGMDIKPYKDGWEFTGDDIKLLSSYFSSGGSYGNLTSQLGSSNNFFGSGSISPFWSSFNGGNTFGGVKVQGGNMTWWTNGANLGGNNIQGLNQHKTKVNQGEINDLANNNKNTDSSGWATAALGFMAADISVPDPSDLAWQKWAGYAIVGGGIYMYLKMEREIEGIRRRNQQPQGILYELRATRSGLYPNLNTGGTTNLNVGDVWKYGESINPNGRYPDSKIDPVKMGLQMEPIFYGTQMEIKIQEKIMIYSYYFSTGVRPPGNPIFR